MNPEEIIEFKIECLKEACVAHSALLDLALPIIKSLHEESKETKEKLNKAEKDIAHLTKIADQLTGIVAKLQEQINDINHKDDFV